MLARRNGQAGRSLVKVVASASLILFPASAALARVALNTMDPVAVVADDGRHVVVTGPLTCTDGEGHTFM